MKEISIPLPIVHDDPKRASMFVFDPTGLRVGTGMFQSDSSICTLVADGFDEEDVQETIWTRGDKGVPTKGHVLWVDRRAELALLDWLLLVEGATMNQGGGVMFGMGGGEGRPTFILQCVDLPDYPPRSHIVYAARARGANWPKLAGRIIPDLAALDDRPLDNDPDTLREALAIIVRHYANWPSVTGTP